MGSADGLATQKIKAMAYAIYHVEKGNISSGGIGNHIDRKEGKKHTYQHADPERRHLNKNIVVPNNRQRMPLADAINDRIKEGYKGNRAIRKDAVKYCTHILTGSHEKMKDIFSSEETAKDWIKRNYAFMAKEFGEQNIVRFSVHMDEKTPHIHAVTVPLTEDGRLSAKEVIGNRTKMQLRQDRYADIMQKFGLERGMKGTGIKHETAKEYYTRISESHERGQKIGDFTAKKKVLGVEYGTDTAKTIENLQNALKSFKTAQIHAEQQQRNAEKENEQLKKKINAYDNDLESVISNVDIFEGVRNSYVKSAMQDILYDYKRTINNRFDLHKLTEKERKEYALKIAGKYIRENVRLKGDLRNELLTKPEFKAELLKAVEDRAKKTLKFSQTPDRRQDRNRGLKL